MRCILALTVLAWIIPSFVGSEIIYFRPDEPLSAGTALIPTPDDFLDLDLNNDGVNELTLRGKILSEFDSVGYGNTLVLGRPPPIPNAGVYQIPLRANDYIEQNVSLGWWDATQVGWGNGAGGNLFASFRENGGIYTGIGFWRDDSPVGGSADGYLGVQFDIEGNTHYGWIHVINTYGNSGYVTEWAYESTPNMGIAAGAIPEPSSLVLLFAGAFGIWTLRKRKKC